MMKDPSSANLTAALADVVWRDEDAHFSTPNVMFHCVIFPSLTISPSLPKRSWNVGLWVGIARLSTFASTC